MARRPYTTRARFFRDDDREIKIKWLPADPARGTFPGVSRVCSLDWVTHPETAEGVGEVFGSPRSYNHGKPFVGIEGNHFCGTPDEHRNGEVFDPTRPEQKYNPSGLPLCCNPNRREADGGVKLKTITHHIYSNPYPSSGGAKLKTATHTIRSDPHRTSGGAKAKPSVHIISSNPYHSTGGPKVKHGIPGVAEGVYHSTGGPKVLSKTRYVPSVRCPLFADTCLLGKLGWRDQLCIYPMPAVTDAVPLFFTGWRLWEVRADTTYALDLSLEHGHFIAGDYELWRGFSCIDRELVFHGSLVGLSTLHIEIDTGIYDRVFLKLIGVRSSVSLDPLSITLSTL